MAQPVSQPDEMEMAQPTCQPDGNGLCLSRELALIAPAPSSLPAFHCHLKGSNYTLCTVQYNAHYPNRLHWGNCSAVQSKAATSRHFANKERERADHQLWPERSSRSLSIYFLSWCFPCLSVQKKATFCQDLLIVGSTSSGRGGRT